MSWTLNGPKMQETVFFFFLVLLFCFFCRNVWDIRLSNRQTDRQVQLMQYPFMWGSLPIYLYSNLLVKIATWHFEHCHDIHTTLLYNSACMQLTTENSFSFCSMIVTLLDWIWNSFTMAKNAWASWSAVASIWK